MITDIIKSMERLDVLDSDTKKAIGKGTQITLGSAMLLGGMTLSIAGVLTITSFFSGSNDEEIEKKSSTAKHDYYDI